MITYAKARRGGATLSQIAELKADLQEEQQSKIEAGAEATAIQDMINGFSPGMKAEDRGKLVGKYGEMFGESAVAKGKETLDARAEIDRAIGTIDDKDSTDTLLLREILGAIDRLNTTTIRKGG
tara:strand:- start:398 stop:769 length:372 start_codon:yes stop_codon:yes gene_type:complete